MIYLAVALLYLSRPQLVKGEEISLPTLQVGSRVYTNVTVTTKAKKYIFILHSTGMENIRVADLSEEMRDQLGYVPEVTKAQKASNWAKGKMAELHIGNVKGAELQVAKKWDEQSAIVLEKARSLDSKLCGALMGGALLIYLLYSYCFVLICEKTRQKPTMLVWVPIFQLIPLLRAAGMSAGWFLLSCTPLTPTIWSFKIANALGKSPAIGLLLWPALIAPFALFYLPFSGLAPDWYWLALPAAQFLAFVYLGFSEGAAPSTQKTRPRSELMTLETA